MKIAILGGGGFRVPLVYGALLARAERLGLEHVSLYDVDASRLAQIAPVLEGLERERGSQLGFTATTQLDDALDGADFVFCAIRVGNLEGRVVDERVPLDEGVVGQETTGPGGLCFALRTVPVMVELARRVAERAPQAWFVNFTNPAGLVTEAIRTELGDRALGICDSPAGTVPARRGRARPRSGRPVVRLLRPQPPRLAAVRPRRDARPAARVARRRRPARDVRGGPSLRRRVAPRARDDPERVPLLLLLRLRHRRRASLGARVARGVPAASAGSLLRHERPLSRELRSTRGGARGANARRRISPRRMRPSERRGRSTGTTSAATRAKRSASSRRSRSTSVAY